MKKTRSKSLPRNQILVWDRLLRVFHWSLVLSFAIAWLSAEDMATLHLWAGYAAAALIGFRLVWGLVGPHYAQFDQFLRSPKTIITYLRMAVAGKEPRYIGHNPAGGAMIVALLGTMGLTTYTGWMMTLPQFAKVAWIKDSHEALATAMLVLVLGHLIGVFLASRRHGENLALSMINGIKRAAKRGDVA